LFSAEYQQYQNVAVGLEAYEDEYDEGYNENQENIPPY
jgi:hypothetical protein